MGSVRVSHLHVGMGRACCFIAALMTLFSVARGQSLRSAGEEVALISVEDEVYGSVDDEDSPRHFVFFNLDRHRITEPEFLETEAFAGAQLTYRWWELEPNEGAYDFEALESDLAFLSSVGKRLFIQLQDASFASTIYNVPPYLLEDPKYNGGVAMQIDYPSDDESSAVPAGWVARRWDPAVQGRFHLLLAELGGRFDGRIEGINLPGTAVEFGATGKRFPKGFTPEGYRDAVVANMKALREAFSNSIVIQYVNSMPGERLLEADRGLLASVFANARELGVGVGGPDLVPFAPAQMTRSYRLIRASSGTVPVGMAVQRANYANASAQSRNEVTITELVKFARDYLGADYIFWAAEEPYYTKRLIPLLRRDP